MFENPRELCRLCLQKVVQGMRVFNEPHPLSLTIYLTVGLQIKNEEHLPDEICMDCYAELHRAYTFKKQCEAADTKLALHSCQVKGFTDEYDPSVDDNKSLDKPVQTDQSIYNIAETTFILLNDDTTKYDIYNVVTLNGISRTICTSLDQSVKNSPSQKEQSDEFNETFGYLNEIIDQLYYPTNDILPDTNQTDTMTDSGAGSNRPDKVSKQQPNDDSTDNENKTHKRRSIFDVNPTEDTQIDNPKIPTEEEDSVMEREISSGGNREPPNIQDEYHDTKHKKLDSLTIINKEFFDDPLVLQNVLNPQIPEEKSKDLQDTLTELNETLIAMTYAPHPDDARKSVHDIQTINVSSEMCEETVELEIMDQENRLVVLEQAVSKVTLRVNDDSENKVAVEESEIAQINLEKTENILQNTFDKDINIFIKKNKMIEDINDNNNMPTITRDIKNKQHTNQNVGNEKNRQTETKSRRKMKRGKDAWCNVCRKYFATRTLLVRHRRAHLADKPCASDLVDDITQDNMKSEGTNEKKKSCGAGVEPQAIAQQETVVSHMRSQAMLQPRKMAQHRCRLCPKTFLHSSGLNRHMRIHRGRNSLCVFCNLRFRDKSSLLRHLKSASHMSQKHLADNV